MEDLEQMQDMDSKPAKRLALWELEALCDDPMRDLPAGVDVRAVLAYEPEEGFYLSALDGNVLHEVVDNTGKCIRFRTIEAALAVLQRVAGLSPLITLVQAPASALQTEH